MNYRLYLSARTAEFYNDPDHFGYMINIKNRVTWSALADGCYWMLDNGAFTGYFSEEKWIAYLNDERLLAARDKCLGVIIPDVVFDWQGTLALFEEYYMVAKSRGYPVAYATQTGQPIETIPWDRIDTVFIGGDHHHKRVEAVAIAKLAHTLGIHVHVGRVGSGMRIHKSFPWADSVDGSTFAYGTRASKVEKAQKIVAALDYEYDSKEMPWVRDIPTRQCEWCEEDIPFVKFDYATRYANKRFCSTACSNYSRMAK